MKGRVFGTLQTAIVAAYALSGYFARGPLLFSAARAGVAGDVLCLAGLAILAPALFAVRAVVQPDANPRSGGHLVTNGIYARFRHPLYTAVVLNVVGLSMIKPTLIGAITSAFVIVSLALKVRYEERLLVERYPEYAEYRSTAWGLIPGTAL